MSDHAEVITISESKVVTRNRAVLMGMQVGTDGSNDPTITIYNGTDSSCEEILPSVTFDASVLGIKGLVIPYYKKAYNGIYVEISCAGTVEVTIDYKTLC